METQEGTARPAIQAAAGAPSSGGSLLTGQGGTMNDRSAGFRRAAATRPGPRVLGLVLTLAALLAATPPSRAQPSSVPEVKRFSEGFVGLGACIGKGAGLIGLYGYARPLSFLALEVAAGKRLFLFQPTGEVFLPYMVAAKLQVYFSPRQRQSQFGIEAGWLKAEDAGTGAELSGILQYRLTRNVNVDGNFGFGFFSDVEGASREYVTEKTGYTGNYELFTTPIFLMWGVGLALTF